MSCTITGSCRPGWQVYSLCSDAEECVHIAKGSGSKLSISRHHGNAHGFPSCSCKVLFSTALDIILSEGVTVPDANHSFVKTENCTLETILVGNINFTYHNITWFGVEVSREAPDVELPYGQIHFTSRYSFI